MKFKNFIIFGITIFLSLSACTVRTYKVNQPRVDQELAGNRGYLLGLPSEIPKERKSTRTIQQIELELHPSINFGKNPKQKIKKEDKELWGNLGYIYRRSLGSEKKESVSGNSSRIDTVVYTVKDKDTLQKISKKFYGTSRYWYKIYEANKNIISDPDRIYPGQVINIPPVDIQKETQGN